MRLFAALAAIIVLLILLIAAGLREISNTNSQPAAAIQISMSSQPFPMSVGRATLMVSITEPDGTPISGAAVSMVSEMKRAGMLPLRGQAAAVEDTYHIPIIWSASDQWMVTVSATLPNDRGTITEQFEVYVYPVPITSANPSTAYRSTSEYQAMRPDPQQTLTIIIPQGTADIVRMGHAEDLIPQEIRLNVRGQNTLLIINDDITDHTIGPFFVRAGERIRQTFTQPAVYEGTCTILHSATVSLIVEE